MTENRNLAATDHHDLPLSMSEQAHAANSALFAGKKALDTASEAWAMVKEVYPTTYGRSFEDAPKGEQVARRLAVRLTQEAGRTIGLVSSSACGLWVVDEHGRIGSVVSTNGGSDYLDGVEWVRTAKTTPEPEPLTFAQADEYPVRSTVAYFDTYADAYRWLNPEPRRFPFPRS